MSLNPYKNKSSKKYDVSDYWNGASVKSLGYLMKNTTGILNTLVQGGRAYNEKHWLYYAENILDIDLSGCYANALKGFSYPIGLLSKLLPKCRTVVLSNIF